MTTTSKPKGAGQISRNPVGWTRMHQPESNQFEVAIYRGGKNVSFRCSDTWTRNQIAQKIREAKQVLADALRRLAA